MLLLVLGNPLIKGLKSRVSDNSELSKWKLVKGTSVLTIILELKMLSAIVLLLAELWAP